MSARFAEACFNSPSHRVLGMRLRPLTFWHAWQLEFAEVPWRAARLMNAPDLCAAAAICASRPKLPGELVSVPWWLRRLLAWRCCRGRLSLERRRWAAYVSDYYAPPLVWETDDGRPVKSPSHLYCVAYLMRHGGFSHREAWAMEAGYGRHLSTALAEAGGADPGIITAAEIEALEAAGYRKEDFE